VKDVWGKQAELVRSHVQQGRRRIESLRTRKNQIFDAYIDKRITQDTYEEQTDRVAKDIALAEIAVHDSELDELEVEAVLAFAEYALRNTARLWLESNVEQKQKLQRVLFPMDCPILKKGIWNSCN
jgi:hypothetical protein